MYCVHQPLGNHLEELGVRVIDADHLLCVGVRDLGAEGVFHSQRGALMSYGTSKNRSIWLHLHRP